MSLIAKTISKRLNKSNRNFLGLCVGPTGSGKSYSMMRLAELVDPDFNIDFVVFTYNEFIDLLNSGRVKKGNIILWDEAGVEAASREAMTKRNRHISKIMQTFRHRNIGLLMTVPDSRMVDKQIRMLIHLMFTATGWNSYTHKSFLRVTQLQHNTKIGKTYPKAYKIKKDGVVFDCSSMVLHLPSKKLRDAYEKKKTDFTTNLNKNSGGVKDTVREDNVGLSAFEKAYQIVRGDTDRYLKKSFYKKVKNPILNSDLVWGDMKLGKLPHLKVEEVRGLKATIEAEIKNGELDVS